MPAPSFTHRSLFEKKLTPFVECSRSTPANPRSYRRRKVEPEESFHCDAPAEDILSGLGGGPYRIRVDLHRRFVRKVGRHSMVNRNARYIVSRYIGINAKKPLGTDEVLASHDPGRSQFPLLRAARGSLLIVHVTDMQYFPIA